MFQLLLLLLVLVGIGLAVWAFVTTSPKKDNKENGKETNKNNSGNNNNGEEEDNKENGKETNKNNSGNNNNGEEKECKWKEYAGKDNNAISPCDDDKCRLEDTTEKECKKACCEMEGCKAVQWRSTDGRCLLKLSVGDINDAAKEKTLFVKE